MEKFDGLSIDGRRLKLFLAIYDERSVSRAGDLFGLNQSTVSHHLDRLRSAMNDPLFLRVGKKLVPTDYASSIVPRVRALVGDLEGLSKQDDYRPSEDTTTISIACNTSELMSELVQLRDALSFLAPRAPIRVLELGGRDRILDLLHNHVVNLVITIRAPVYDPALNWMPFLQDRNVCYYDPNTRDPIRNLEDYTSANHAVLDFGGAGTSTVARVLNEISMNRRIMFSGSDVHLLAEMISGTDMVATMQSGLHRTVFQKLAWCDAPISLPPVNFDIVWHRRSENAPRNVWLRELIRGMAFSPTNAQRIEPVD